MVIVSFQSGESVNNFMRILGNVNKNKLEVYLFPISMQKFYALK